MKSTQIRNGLPVDFEENSSLVTRLRAIIIAVLLLIILGFVGIYFSSQPFLKGLQDLNAANLTMTSITNCLETLNSSNTELDNFLQKGKSRDARYVFFESQKLFKLNLDSAIQNANTFPEVRKILIEARRTNFDFETTAMVLLSSTKFKRESAQADVIVAHQFSSETEEELRRAFISMKNRSDLIFNRIYKGRFKPLIMAVILSTVFLTFVLIFGFSIADRLRKSLHNLLRATEEVSKGDYTYRAEILNPDEIGKVTYAFNDMMGSLEELRRKNILSAERISLLQTITASFSEALTPDQVFDIVVDKGFKSLGANAGVIATISKDGHHIEFPRLEGYPGERITSYPITSETPIADTIRYGLPIFLENLDELLGKYPDSNADRGSVSIATAVLPMTVGSEILGALAFSFDHARIFTDEDKEFMIALTRQSAQALHRSQLFEDARKAVQARDEFLSIASHELKTPLTPLKLQLQGLERKVKRENLQAIPVAQISKIIQSSDKQISRLARLIEDLLDVSRIQAGKLNLNKEKFNLGQMIDEVVKHYADQLKDILSEINLKVDPSIEGYLDRVRIEQVLINFLTNAGKYAPGKPVTIHLTRQDGQAKLIVKDQGPGISAHDQARIFDRFERVRAKDNIGGLGLGLYISKQIVDAHGGDISVESEPGHGASFIVTLPLNEQRSLN